MCETGRFDRIGRRALLALAAGSGVLAYAGLPGPAARYDLDDGKVAFFS